MGFLRRAPRHEPRTLGLCEGATKKRRPPPGPYLGPYGAHRMCPEVENHSQSPGAPLQQLVHSATKVTAGVGSTSRTARTPRRSTVKKALVVLAVVALLVPVAACSQNRAPATQQPTTTYQAPSTTYTPYTPSMPAPSTTPAPSAPAAGGCGGCGGPAGCG